jgi:hypothetical protein
MIFCDAGAETKVTGVSQAKQACRKLNVPYMLRNSERAFRFGDARRKSLGIIRVPFPTPVGIRELLIDVFDLDVPILLGLDSLVP